jgi:hypothetical protein
MWAASRAPSPDNNQPWAFRAADDRIETFHCRERAVPSDVEDLFAGIAMGAAIENIALEASQHALRCDVDYPAHPFTRDGALEPIATLRLAPPGGPDQLAGFIEERTTNRRRYQTTSLAKSEAEALSNAINDPNCRIDWLTSRTDLRSLAGLVSTADRIRFEYQPFHDELHRMLRFGRSDLPAVDGLEAASLEIPRPAWPLLRWLRPWRRMSLLNRLGASRLFAATSTLQIRCSGAVGLLRTERKDAIGAIQAGRALQRIWLAATEQRLAFHPLGALPLFLRRLEVCGESAFLPHHARRLVLARDGFLELFPEAREGLPVILFRIGHCGPPSARSGRFPLERIELP